MGRLPVFRMRRATTESHTSGALVEAPPLFNEIIFGVSYDSALGLYAESVL